MFIVLDVAEAATAAEARVAKLVDGLATGGRLNEAASNGVDDSDIVADSKGIAMDEAICGIFF